ncbi:hypothetical protein Pcinc_040083 [Petrolisthes cinctipes]|uniref:Uncharacterized protein n=1 Tax=Petrolisthes cinctipes TaxID=88211 RepID=A0AAE1BPW3_PETCI|nr:hypothetical protein Pcinc_040083 [Petrolisthes cinctipes]
MSARGFRKMCVGGLRREEGADGRERQGDQESLDGSEGISEQQVASSPYWYEKVKRIFTISGNNGNAGN